MVRPFFLMAALTATAACDIDRYDQPIRPPVYGKAVRQNLAAHVISPIPAAAPRPSVDGQRTLLATDAYRTGEVKDPTAQSTAPNTTDAEE